jgi:hypothetical protein
MSKNLARKVKRRYTHPILSRSSRTQAQKGTPHGVAALTTQKYKLVSRSGGPHMSVIFSGQQIHYEKRKGQVKEKLETLFYVTL